MSKLNTSDTQDTSVSEGDRAFHFNMPTAATLEELGLADTSDDYDMPDDDEDSGFEPKYGDEEVEEETEEDEESEEEASEEDEESEEGEESEEDEESEEEPKAKEKPKVLKEIPQKKEKPLLPQQAQAYFKSEYLKYIYKYNGHAINEDGSNIREIADGLSASDVIEMNSWAEEQARQRTGQYIREEVEPYVETERKNAAIRFFNRFASKHPDVWDLREKMAKAQDKLYKDFPEFQDDPARAIPMLYMMVKEKAIKEVKTRTQKAKLETGRAKVKGVSTRKVNKIVRALNTSEAMDPLSGIFDVATSTYRR